MYVYVCGFRGGPCQSAVGQLDLSPEMPVRSTRFCWHELSVVKALMKGTLIHKS